MDSISRSNASIGLFTAVPVLNSMAACRARFGHSPPAQVGQSQQRLPYVSGTVVQGRGDLRTRCGDGSGMVAHEPRALLFEGGGFEVSQSIAGFAGQLALDRDD